MELKELKSFLANKEFTIISLCNKTIGKNILTQEGFNYNSLKNNDNIIMKYSYFNNTIEYYDNTVYNSSESLIESESLFIPVATTVTCIS